MVVGGKEVSLDYVRVICETDEEIPIFVPATNLLMMLTGRDAEETNNDMKPLRKNLPELIAEKNLISIDFEDLAKTSAAYHTIKSKKSVVISGDHAGLMVRMCRAGVAETNREEVLEGLSELYGKNDIGLALHEKIRKVQDTGKKKAAVLEPALHTGKRKATVMEPAAEAKKTKIVQKQQEAPPPPFKAWNPWLGPDGANCWEEHFNTAYVMPGEMIRLMVRQLWYPMSTMIDGFVFNPIRAMSSEERVSFNNCIWTLAQHFQGHFYDNRGYVADGKVRNPKPALNRPNYTPWRLVTTVGLHRNKPPPKWELYSLLQLGKHVQMALECFYGVGQPGAMVPEYIEWLHRCNSHKTRHDPKRYVKPDISGIALDDLFINASTIQEQQHAVLRAFLRLYPKFAMNLFFAAGSV